MEVRVSPFTKELPEAPLGKRDVGCDLKLEDVALRRVQVDGVDAGGALHDV